MSTITSQLQSLIDSIQKNNREVSITPRELFRYFSYERRTPGNCKGVDAFLEENNLVVDPHYNDVWIDDEITIKAKEKAQRKSTEDPIKRLRILEAANKVPSYVSVNARLEEAITCMMKNDYSQLPVTKNALRGIEGYISWQTIGEAVANGENRAEVRYYINKNYKSLPLNTPLLEAIESVYCNDFIIVQGANQEMCGIVTTSDISSQFLAWTKPFVLLEEIENQIRRLMDGKFLLEELVKVCQEKDRKVNTIDDLTFGEYIRILQDPKNWAKLNLKSVDQKMFIKTLDDVREARNDVMHFDPAGLSNEQYKVLSDTATYLKKLSPQFENK